MGTLARKTIACLLLVFMTIAPLEVQARTVTDIQNDKTIAANQLSTVNQQLAAAESELKAKKAVESSASSEVAKLQAQIDSINATLQVNKLKLEQLAEETQFKEILQEEMEQQQDVQVGNAYLGWKTGAVYKTFFGGTNIVKNAIYNDVVSSNGYGTIQQLAEELQKIKQNYVTYQEQSQNLQKDMDKLNADRQAAEAKLAAARSATSKTSGLVSGLRSQSSQLQSQISFLSKEEQDQINREMQQLQNATNPNGGSNQLQSGQIYFGGRGRDSATGHGIGFSQLGGLGASLIGWDYKKIVEFYFPGARVQKIAIPGTVYLNDKKITVDMESYVSGLGEVADKSCESMNLNFRDQSNIYTCWPAEVIKAQVVVARTYAARRAGSICSTAACQVYKGGEAKRWASDATIGEVVTWNGGMADVYYSADNNQGYGTADKETIWGCGRYLYQNGPDDNCGSRKIAYLSAANDSSFAYKAKFTACGGGWCGNWSWRTNSYTLDQLQQFISWANVDSSNRYPNSFRNTRNIGTLQDISVSKDSSQRVNRVTLRGSNGTAYVEGRWFKMAWNQWINEVRPSGQSDYIFSFSYSVIKV